jgi:hypothetical protein
MIKQVYRVKKDGRLNKHSDLTLDIEKPNIEKSSASSTDQIVPNKEHIANNLAEQQSCLAGVGHTPGTHTRKDEDELLLEFPCNPTRTRSV